MTELADTTMRSIDAGDLTEPLQSPDLTARHQTLRRAFSQFPSGVIAICTLGPDGPVGMAVSSFTSVSLEPALVSICIDRASTTWPKLSTARRIGISVLGAEQAELCKALAARNADRFATATWHASPDDAVFLAGASLWLDCRVDRTIQAGDHDIVLFEVLGTRAHDGHHPLVFHRSTLRTLES
ncbi:flavin reductase family protein [Rhodococcus rhodochrous]|uniref:Flavin reductase family protein n=1 Tax=Rhodococcus rhodochrous TaxID=1829 RepID=A0AAW4XNX3_RHORH|nr:flavin reductase family protein [Rhodococcus rhodochrous]MCD2114875.1 flavin reductase family protein [Rhodococcus rhodochrous]TWH44239.1 flavin reductase (DIM6/NTAB) family NADH-FMN oxidoreductase RutF [Rhodococcus rhodochrous J38]